MKFTIGTVSNFHQFEQDLRLIKSSLLYADEIELIGLTEYVTFRYLPRVLDCQNNLEEFIDGLIPFLRSINVPGKEEALQQIESAKVQLKAFDPYLKKKKCRSKAELQAQMAVRRMQNDLQAQLSETMQKLVSPPSSSELQTLLDRNLIRVFDYQLKEINADELTGGYIGNMLNAIYASNTFPLFDSASTDVIGSIAKTKVIEISKLDAEVLRHAGIATSILMTLPTLDSATYDELIDLRQQNAAPLARFRKAVYGFSEKISSLPWDRDFQYECLKIYDTEVAPEVAEINEVFTDTSTLKNLGRKVLADEEIRKKAGLAVGGLATAITTSSSLSGFLRNLLLAMSIATFSTEAATTFFKIINLGVQSHDEAQKTKKQAKENVMYYYYLASKI